MQIRIPTGPHENTCYYTVNGLQLWMSETEILTTSPYDNFVYALKAESSKPGQCRRKPGHYINKTGELPIFDINFQDMPRIYSHPGKIGETNSLRTAQANDYSLNKEQTSYSDSFDALRLGLLGFNIK